MDGGAETGPHHNSGEPRGSGIAAELHSPLPAGAILLEHAPIAFPNYPYEWSPQMLRAAAALTLEMADAAMRAGFVLKDATPYNVMFEGPKPIFLDVLSFRRRDPLESIWQPYAQFVRTFVYPLLACGYFGLRLNEILLAHRDGLEPERFLALCPAYRLLFPPFFPPLHSRFFFHAASTLPQRIDTRCATPATLRKRSSS